MSNKPPPQTLHISKEDEALFLEAVKHVKPLHQKSHVPTSAPQLKQKVYEEKIIQNKMDFSDTIIKSPNEEKYGPDSAITFCKTGFNPKHFKKFKAGRYRAEKELDLHRFTVDQAYSAFLQFIYNAVLENIRIVRIIHGKGGRNKMGEARIKNHVIFWLEQCPEVLAFSTAPPKQGGTGAILVWLKRV